MLCAEITVAAVNRLRTNASRTVAGCDHRPTATRSFTKFSTSTRRSAKSCLVMTRVCGGKLALGLSTALGCTITGIRLVAPGLRLASHSNEVSSWPASSSLWMTGSFRVISVFNSMTALASGDRPQRTSGRRRSLPDQGGSTRNRDAVQASGTDPPPDHAFPAPPTRCCRTNCLRSGAVQPDRRTARRGTWRRLQLAGRVLSFV